MNGIVSIKVDVVDHNNNVKGIQMSMVDFELIIDKDLVNHKNDNYMNHYSLDSIDQGVGVSD